MSEELFAAIKRGDAVTVRQLLEKDPHLACAVDDNGVSAVLAAYYYGKSGIADVLRKKHPGLNIFEAATAGDTGRVDVLIDRDPALTNAYAPDGFHPLGLAAFFRRADVLRVLLERGADVAAPARNKLAVTALHSAVATDAGPVDHEIVRALLDAGAPVNVPHLGGGTPLHAAAFTGDIESIRMLLEHGADPALRLDDGRTVVDVARDRRHEDAARILEKANARS